MTREKFDRLQQWFHKTHDIEPEVFNESKSQTFNRSTSTPYFLFNKYTLVSYQDKENQVYRKELLQYPLKMYVKLLNNRQYNKITNMKNHQNNIKLK